MRGFNKVIIAGNLTKEPDLRYTASKRAFARFGVAVSYSYKDNNGEFKEGTDFINVVAWNATAEKCGKYLKKGSPVLIEGRIKTGSYEAKDGSGKRYTTDILVDNLIMLGSSQQGGNNNSGGSRFSGSGMGEDFIDSLPLGGFGDSPISDADFGSPIGERGFNSDSSSSDEGSGTNIPF